jgi:hypothetical protein
MEYEEFCRRCEHYQLAMPNGITCALTNEKPNFVGECKDFKPTTVIEGEIVKSSEEKQSSQTVVPEKLGFSWGAFGLTGLWLLFHGRIGAFFAVLILSFIPILGQIIVFFMALNYGSEGHAIAWERGNFKSVAELKQKELGWDIAGALVFAIVLIFSSFVIYAKLMDW